MTVLDIRLSAMIWTDRIVIDSKVAGNREHLGSVDIRPKDTVILSAAPRGGIYVTAAAKKDTICTLSVDEIALHRDATILVVDGDGNRSLVKIPAPDGYLEWPDILRYVGDGQ